MFNTPLPGPLGKRHREHEVAQPERCGALLAQIPDDAGQLQRLRNRHLLSAQHLDAPLLLQLFRLAARYEAGELGNHHPATCKILSNLFFDQARNHTRLSFNTAWLRLGGSLLNFERSSEQITHHRHAPDEIAELCNNYGDLAVVRTVEAAWLEEAIELFQVPVINAGNGQQEHPTHAMADLYTLLKWRPALAAAQVDSAQRLQIGIFGHPSRMATLRSFLYLLAKLPQLVERVVVFSRLEPALDPAELQVLADAGVRVESSAALLPGATAMESYRKLLPEMDLLYIHLAHAEEFSRLDFLEALNYFKSDAMVLNPDILHQELSDRLNNSVHNGYFAQARGSVYLRMAVMAGILG